MKKKNNNVRKEKMYLGGLVALMHPKMAEGRPIGRLTTDNKELRSFLHSILLFEKKLITMDSGAQCVLLVRLTDDPSLTDNQQFFFPKIREGDPLSRKKRLTAHSATSLEGSEEVLHGAFPHHRSHEHSNLSNCCCSHSL